MADIIWTPQPKQAVFMSRGEDEVLYGGAAGGGKSDALVMEALRQVHIPHYRGLILRKTYPELGELIDKSQAIYPRAFPKARYNGSAHTWSFPSGAKLRFGAMHHERDRFKYQGHAYAFIAFDELTHFTQKEYEYLLTRNRPNGPGVRCYVRATANPGGVGHGWVKERFVTAARPLETHWHKAEIQMPDGGRREVWRSRVFVPASVFDNPALLRNDPDYVARLAVLPEAERNALLYGSWDSFDGQVFTEWRDDPDHYEDRRWSHVIDPFHLPETWRIYRGLDWGYSRPFSVHWYAVDHDRRLYAVRELYGCTGRANTGVKWEPGRVADAIRRVEGEDPNLKGKRVLGVADPAIFASDGTESIASIMERAGVFFEKGDHQRLAGKMQIHDRLAFDEEGRTMLYVFSTCKHLIRTLPALVYDKAEVEDIDTDGEDHAYDELRYVCMADPISPRPRAARAVKAWSPLDTPEYDCREFYRRY